MENQQINHNYIKAIDIEVGDIISWASIFPKTHTVKTIDGKTTGDNEIEINKRMRFKKRSLIIKVN